MLEVEISKSKVFCPDKLGELTIIYDGQDFSVMDVEGRKLQVQRWALSKELRGIPQKQLETCLEAAYLSLKKIGEDYAIEFNSRLNGGGIEQVAAEAVKAIWQAGGHRTAWQWLSQATHRTILNWWRQGNHRGFWEWMSGVVSRNRIGN